MLFGVCKRRSTCAIANHHTKAYLRKSTVFRVFSFFLPCSVIFLPSGPSPSFFGCNRAVYDIVGKFLVRTIGFTLSGSREYEFVLKVPVWWFLRLKSIVRKISSSVAQICYQCYTRT